MKTDVHIYGVHARDSMISAIVAKLNIPSVNVHYDDRSNGGGTLYTAKKAWLAPIPEGVTHRIALQDDVEVCDHFLDIAEQIVVAHPKSIISLFPFDFMRRFSALEECDTPYFEPCTLSACGIIMPIDYIQPCFNYIKQRYNDACDDDYGIRDWARYNGVQILTTIPALIQHLGDDSIANKGSPIRRTVYYEQNPKANWASQKVMQYQIPEWFFSNHGKMRTDGGTLRVVAK